VWVLDDWRLDVQGRITEDFYHFHDIVLAGRLGRQLTVNGELQPQHLLTRLGCAGPAACAGLLPSQP
jgi:hypothetical protein